MLINLHVKNLALIDEADVFLMKVLTFLQVKREPVNLFY